MWTPCMEPRVVPTLHKHFRSLRSTAGACERHCGPPVGPWGPPLPGWVNIDAEGRWRRPGLQGGGSVQGSCGVAARDPSLGCVAALRLRSRWELWAETGAVGPAWVPSQPTLSVDFFSLQNQMGELKNQSFIKPRVGPLGEGPCLQCGPVRVQVPTFLGLATTSLQILVTGRRKQAVPGGGKPRPR